MMLDLTLTIDTLSSGFSLYAMEEVTALVSRLNGTS